MKTLYKTYTKNDMKKCHKRRKSLEKRSGVRWTFYLTKAGMKFQPIITGETPSSDGKAAEKILPNILISFHSDFQTIKDGSREPWPVVLAGCYTLVKTGEIVGRLNVKGYYDGFKRLA